MRVALLYPPPWKIAEAGQEPDPVDGPPENFHPSDLDPDFHQTPYGLFSLGAQARRAGHEAKVLNLSSFSWRETVEVIQRLGVHPGETAVLEDATSGILAGYAAGTKVIAVPNRYLPPPDEVLAKAKVVIDTLESLEAALRQLG